MKKNGNSLGVVSAADFSVAHGGLIPVRFERGKGARARVRSPGRLRNLSERILQRELNQPRRADGLGDLADVGTLLNVGKPKVQWVLE